MVERRCPNQDEADHRNRTDQCQPSSEWSFACPPQEDSSSCRGATLGVQTPAGSDRWYASQIARRGWAVTVDELPMNIRPWPIVMRRRLDRIRTARRASRARQQSDMGHGRFK
jgi:hypothetical protein